MQSTTGIVRSKALASGEGSTTGSVTLEGQSIDLENGYLAATQLGDFNVVTNSPNADVTLSDAQTGSPCFTFNGSANPDDPADVSAVLTWDGSACN